MDAGGTRPHATVALVTACAPCLPTPASGQRVDDDEWILMGKRQQRPIPTVRDTMARGVRTTSPSILRLMRPGMQPHMS